MAIEVFKNKKLIYSILKISNEIFVSLKTTI